MPSYEGLRNHPNLWAHLPLQASAAAIGQTSGDGVLVGSPTFAATDPFGRPALRLNGSTQYVDLSAINTPLGDTCQILMRVKVDADPPATDIPTGLARFGEGTNVAGASHYPYTDGIVYCSCLRWTDAVTCARVTVGNPTPALTSWRFVSISNTSGANGWKFRIDGAVIAQATGTTGVYTNGDWDLGRTLGSGTFYLLDGDICDLWVFKGVVLSDAEHDAIMAGPSAVTGVRTALQQPLARSLRDGLSARRPNLPRGV